MDAVKFLQEADRMHNFDGHDCVECEIYKHSSGNLSCVNWVLSHPDEAVKVVEQWAKEHPTRTRQDIYLEEQIPSSLKKFATITPKVDSNGALDLCPADVYCEADCKLDSKESHGKSSKDVCDECHKIFWLEEVE